MKSILSFSVIMLLLGTVSSAALRNADEDPAGKKVFIEKKCMTCHSVDSQGLTLEAKKANIPDLSFAGDHNDSAFIVEYLKKNEKINDKAHPMAFKGTDEELKSLADWLASLKNDTAVEEEVMEEEATQETE